MASASQVSFQQIACSDLVTANQDLDAVIFQMARERLDLGNCRSMTELLATIAQRQQFVRVFEARPHSQVPIFDGVRAVLGSPRSRYDKATQAAVDYLLGQRAADAWEHLLAILQRAARGRNGKHLFLPVSDLRFELPGGGLLFEDAAWETRRWIEEWLRQRIAPWHGKTASEILAAADRGVFRHLGHDCICDLKNEIRDTIPLDRSGKKATLISSDEIATFYADVRRNPFDRESDLVRKPFDAAKYLQLATTKNVGNLDVGLRAILRVFLQLGDVERPLFEAAVMREIERELGGRPERAKKYNAWFREHVKRALSRNPVLQAIHADLAKPEPLFPPPPAIGKGTKLMLAEAAKLMSPRDDYEDSRLEEMLVN